MKKLRMPLWVDIIYLLLTILAPSIFILIEAYKVPSTAFKVTFTVCSALLITYIFVKKFVISKYLDKLTAQSSTLELNYSTGVGDEETTKQLWAKNKLIEYMISIVQIILIGSLFLLLVFGLKSLENKLEGTLLFISILYLIAISFRIVMMIIYFIKKDHSTT